MKIFVFRFPALWMGGKAVVVSTDVRKAKSMVLNQHPELTELKKSDIELISTHDINKEGVVWSDNGDY